MGLIMSSFIKKTKAAIRAFHEGGKITKANQDFWNAVSPFEETAAPDRYIMTGRARWLKANNPVMANIDGAIIDNVVRSGIQMQSKTKNRTFNRRVEKRFDMWASSKDSSIEGAINFYDGQRVSLDARMVDGEMFIVMHDTIDGLKLQYIEMDQLHEIVYDAKGKATVYRFKNVSKDGLYYTTDYTEVKAEDVIHYYKSERPSQKRGISEYKRAILDIKNFAAYQDATIKAARARAGIAYSVETEAGARKYGGMQDNDGKNIQAINGIMVYYLNRGEKLNVHAPDAAADDYKVFTETVIRMIATARRVSYELAFKDYQHVNFASSRASLIQDNYHFDEEFTHIVRNVLNIVYARWLKLEIALGNLGVSFMAYKKSPDKYLAPRFIPPQRAWVDPLKDILAIEKEIALNLTTQTDVAQSRGKDFDEIVQRKKEEMEMLKEAGLWVELDGEKSQTQLIAEARAINSTLEEQ